MRAWFVALAAIAVAAGLVASAACGGDGGTDNPVGESASLTRRDDGAGSVTVEATWITAAEAASDGKLREAAARHDDGAALFLVKMDTHSVDLGEYDLSQLSEMQAAGETQAPLEWVPVSEDSHHVEGLLVFPPPSGDGEVTLVIRDVAGVAERRLAWSAAPE